MGYLNELCGVITDFQKKLLIGEFNNLCENTEVRCLRNNIFHTVKVENYEHLVQLRQTHPKVAPMDDEDDMLHSVRRLIWGYNKLRNDYYCTYEGLFWISFGLNKEQLEYRLKNK